MARIRNTVILDSEAATTAATKTIDLNVDEPMTNMIVRFKGTNSSSTPTAYPTKMVSKIELVDGSDVLFSLSGTECVAMNFYERVMFPMQTVDYRDNVMAIPTFLLNFGRYFGDKKLAFDPTKFNNPQLKITHNKALGGSAPDAGSLEVMGNVFDGGGVSPAGFLMTKEHKSFALANSTNEYTNMAVDYPYRMIGIQSLAAQKQPWEQYNKLKLSLNNDKKVLLENNTSDYIKEVCARFGPYHEKIMGKTGATAVVHYVAPTYETSVVATPLSTTAAYFASAQSYGGYVSIKANATVEFQANVLGYAPLGLIPLTFGDLNSPEDYLRLSSSDSMKLKITGGSSVGSSSTCEIITQQLRNY